MVVRLGQVKERVFRQKTDIDRDFPAWAAKRAEHGNEYVRHDARREFFVTVVTLLESAQLSYLLLRDHLTDAAWWHDRIHDVTEDKRKSVLHEYAIMVKWFLLHGLFMAVEETLRAVHRSAPKTFPVSGKFKSIAKVTTVILQAAELLGYEDLFRLTRLTRNTIHTNGVHLPEDESSQEIHYAGETFFFEYGKALLWLNDQRAVWFVEQLVNATEEIVRSSIVATVPYCPRTQLSGP